MTSPDAAVDAGPRRAFLVERYLSSTAAEGLSAASARPLDRITEATLLVGVANPPPSAVLGRL